MNGPAPSVDPADESASFCATLVDEWVRAGARHAVIAPGSRSTPLALAIAARTDLSLHLVHDERSASFAALGIGSSTGRPAILLCTSGTAAAQFHAAVVEGHQSDVPMIVCTADRPPELRDVGAPQTIDQTSLYGSAVRWFHDPGVPAIEAAHTWRALASRVYAETIGARPGPVHLNLPFREPLVGRAVLVPPARVHAWGASASSARPRDEDVAVAAEMLNGRRGVIVAGRGATVDVLGLGSALSWPVLADPLSGLRNGDASVVSAFDSILRSERFATAHVPEVVLRVGAPPASKVLAQWVARSGARILQVSSSHMVVDPDHLVAFTLHGDVATVCSEMAQRVAPTEAGWLSSWSAVEAAAQAAISAALGEDFVEPTVARTVVQSCDAGDNLVVSSSMPIRDVEWFGGTAPGVVVHSNRGTNGIDGVVSTAVGVALGSGRRTRLLIGDVAMVHDSNGLWALAGRGVDLSIVVVNNDGGSIFSFLPQASAVDHRTFETLFGTPHGVDFAALAAAHGIPHVLVATAAELADALDHDGARMVETRFDRSTNVSIHSMLNERAVAAVESVLR